MGILLKDNKDLLKESIEKCSICKMLVNMTENVACNLLKQLNPNIDENACKNILRMRIDGKTLSEIADTLKIPENKLTEIMLKSIDHAETSLDKMIKNMSEPKQK